MAEQAKKVEEKVDSKESEEKGLLIQEFCGYHPPADLIDEVASPPYDVLNSSEAKKIASEKSFLHVNKPEIDLKDNIDLYSDAVYNKGRDNLNLWIKNKWLIKDEKPSMYIYSQKMGNHEQFGLVSELSCKQYENDTIKKHENTRKEKEDDRTKLTDTQSANIGPIFLCYKSNKEINDIIKNFIKNNKPFKKFVGKDKYDSVEHCLWIINDLKIIENLKKLFKNNINYGYIADGHHRAASAWRVYQKRKNELLKDNKYTGNESFNYFLGVLFPDDQLKILDYNRVVHDFGKYKNGEEFLKELKKLDIFEISKIEVDEEYYTNNNEKKINEKLLIKKKYEFGMYVYEKGWYRLVLKDGIIDKVKNDCVEGLDASILSKYVLDKLLDIKDLKKDKRISFVGGIKGLYFLEQKVKSQKSGMAFCLFPTSIKELMSVADNKKLMPPKSTWFEPKLRSGVVVRLF